MKVLLENERATLALNPATQALELEWKKVHDTETYRLMYTKGVEFLNEYKVSRWISDIRNQGVVGPDNSKWMQTEILPKAKAAGLQKIAVVMDSDVFKKFYMKSIEKALDDSKHELLQYFGDKAAAEKWVTSN